SIELKPAVNLGAAVKTFEADKLAQSLETRPEPKMAKEALGYPDIVVRTRALQYLQRKEPKFIAKQASKLLQEENDLFRYTVCEALESIGDKKAARALEALVKSPRPSRNPNVLRMKAVGALGACGDAKSIAVIAPYATSGKYLNALTRVSVEALGEIGLRHKSSKRKIRAILSDAAPPKPDDPKHERSWKILVGTIESTIKKLK
ncbi:MAG: HEAT repeat domain-containing protein, partial [Planctomycetota bacterium]